LRQKKNPAAWKTGKLCGYEYVVSVVFSLTTDNFASTILLVFFVSFCFVLEIRFKSQLKEELTKKIKNYLHRLNESGKIGKTK